MIRQKWEHVRYPISVIKKNFIFLVFNNNCKALHLRVGSQKIKEHNGILETVYTYFAVVNALKSTENKINDYEFFTDGYNTTVFEIYFDSLW